MGHADKTLFFLFILIVNCLSLFPESHSFALQVYNIRALKMVTDSQFETMGVAIGQVATVRAKLSEESANLNSEGTIVKNTFRHSMTSLWLLYIIKTIQLKKDHAGVYHNYISAVKREERIKQIVGQIRMNESKGKKSNPAKCKVHLSFLLGK